MTISIDINPQAQEWLRAEAVRSGVEIPQYVQELIEGVAAGRRADENTDEDPTLALFTRWDVEDATDDAEEIARRQQDGDELLESLAQSPLALRRIRMPDVESS